MRFFQNHQLDLNFFYRSKGPMESAEEVAVIAPPELPWKERARRLFEHARSRVKPDPDADNQKTLRMLLKAGRGQNADLTAYFALLLNRARIRSRIVLAFSRFGVPFHPVVESWRPFSFTFMVEAAPRGEAPLYLSPGNPFATSDTFDNRFLGSLAFRQPEPPGGDWPLIRIPADLPISDTTRLAFSSPFAPDQDEVDLTLETTLHDSAAYRFRRMLGWRTWRTRTKEVKARDQKILELWLDRWANLELKGTPPEINRTENVDQPLVFELKTPWRPEIQKVGGSNVLVPALPRADLFRNPFQAEIRELPIWLPGGRYEVSMTWHLPPGAAVMQVPVPAEATGPRGLAYTMEVAAEVSPDGPEPARLTTRVVVELPFMLPATDYSEVRRFFEGLQRAAGTRLLVATGEAP